MRPIATIAPAMGRFQSLSDKTAMLGINFVEVAESHVLLFGRIKDFVQGESVDQTSLPEFNERCELSLWLAGVGASRFGQLNSFMRLRDAHTEFHQRATEVLSLMHGGNWLAAENMRRNELSQALRRVLIALTELNEMIGKCE